MRRVSGVDYKAPSGQIVRARFEDGKWVVTDGKGRHVFGRVLDQIAYIRAEHGWPLPVRTVY